MEWLKSSLNTAAIWRKMDEWLEEEDAIATGESDYVRLMAFDFCIAVGYGVIVGVGLMIFWLHCTRVRSKERQERASNVAALAHMHLDDVRRLFPGDSFPYWVVMGKYEKVNWINHCIKKVWPLYTKSQSRLMKDTWEPYIDPYRPPSISQISFQEFTLGSIPPVFLGVRMVSATAEEITMDAECQWQGDPSIIMRVRTPLGVTFSIQIKDVRLLVVFRIIFRPLVDELPGFGAFQYSIRKNKKFDFTLRLVGGDIATIPGLGSSVEEMIRNSFLDTLLWPMRIPVPVIPSPVDSDSSRLRRHFNPRRGGVMYYDNTLTLPAAGILDVKLVQAKDLITKDKAQKIRPFAVLFIRQMPRLMKRSKTIDGTLSPIWNELYELEVEEQATQRLVVKILDEEADQENELLGCCQVWLKDLGPGLLTEKWIKLVKNLEKEENVVKYRGEVNLELLYRPYDQQFQPMWTPVGVHEHNGSTSAAPDSPSGSPKASILYNEDAQTRHVDMTTAVHPHFSYKGPLWEVVRGVLSITVEKAENLQPKDSNGLSDAYVVLKMRKSKTRKQTKVIYKTLNPVWDQTLDFLVEDGIHDMLQIKVWDHDTFGRDFLGKHATTLTKVVYSGEYRAEFKLTGVSSGVIFLTLKWTPQPFKKMGQRRLGVF